MATGFGGVTGSGVGGTNNGWFSTPRTRAKKIVLVGHNETRDSLRPIAIKLKAQDHTVSTYFDGDIVSAMSAIFDADFLLVGLSRAGREINSEEHKREKKLLDILASMPKPILCGVVCDVDGHISAPYLTTYGTVVRLVATNDPKVDSLGIFTNPKKVSTDPQAVADAASELLGIPTRA